MTLSRRTFLGGSIVGVGALAAGLRRPAWAQAPAMVTSEAGRPRITYGVQSGDVTADRAIVWSRATGRPLTASLGSIRVPESPG